MDLRVLESEIDDRDYMKSLRFLQNNILIISENVEFSLLLDRLSFRLSEEWRDSTSFSSLFRDFGLMGPIDARWHQALQAAMRETLVELLTSRETIQDQIQAWRFLLQALDQAQSLAQDRYLGSELSRQKDTVLAFVLSKRISSEKLTERDWIEFAHYHSLWRSPDLLAKLITSRISEL